MKTKPILLTSELKPDTPAARSRWNAMKNWALYFSQKLKTSIELIHVEDPFIYPVSETYLSESLQRWILDRRNHLEEIAKTMKAPVRARFLTGSPSERLCELASKKNRYEMIIVGSHGKKGLKRALIGSVAEEIIRNSKMPVFVVGPGAQQKRLPPSKANSARILFATDLSENSAHAQTIVLALGKKLKAEVILFHALLSNLHPAIQPAFSDSIAYQEHLFEFVSALTPHVLHDMKVLELKFRKNRIASSILVDESSLIASSAILKAIQKIQPSFVVTGTHGRTLLASAFLGNTARDLLLNASCPVLVVRSR